MDYQETPEEDSEEGGSIGGMQADDFLADEDLIDSEFTGEENDGLLDPEMLRKNKAQPSKTFSLKARRAIEDHIEQRRLRKELDYLFDDEFAEGQDPKKK